jgi:patatin-like phospholipase/acyl hydrolase
MKRKVTALSIDCGGIRGIIPAVILNYLEEGLQRRAGDNDKGVYLLAGMIAGTSADGILACSYLLTDSKPAREAVGFYAAGTAHPSINEYLLSNNEA